jgi:DNA anti-recombination protein RmuC
MSMEAAAVDRLIEKGRFQPDVAQAIAESVDITIKAANLVTLPVFEARFAAAELKAEARFGALEKSIESVKAWVTYLYAGLVVALFSALAVDHHWLVSREDQLIAQVQERTDRHFEQMQVRADQQLERADRRFEQMQAQTDQRFEQVRARQDEILDQLRALSERVASIQAVTTKQRPSRQ